MECQYETKVKKYSELENCIEIPKFQRSLVWGKEKKKGFIKSLKEGLPIGVLLLSKGPSGKFLVIDGLQRFTTMKDYSNNYFNYIEPAEVTDLDITSVIIASDSAKSNFENYSDNAKKMVKDEIRKCIVSGIQEGHSDNLFNVSNAITVNLIKDISILPTEDQTNIQGAVYTIIDKIEKTANIDDIEVPVLIFKGSNDLLADIYQKLNQEGVKLTKYDIFAATWINDYVYVKDTSFVDLIIKKYEDSEEKSKLEIANFDAEEMRATGKLTVFEYAFGLGKALKKKCPLLFPGTDNDSKVESIGFLILAELLGLEYQEMSKLAETMISYKDLDCTELKNKIIEVTEDVEKTLSPFITSPGSKKGKKQVSLACHSELQLASYIIVLFKLKYDLNKSAGIQKNLSYSKEIKAFKEHLNRHYLYDILRDYWAGSGDSKLEEIISSPDICRYTKDVDKNNFRSVVTDWLSAMNVEKTLKSVSAEVKLFLNYLLILNSTAKDLVGTEYDVEHCTPKKIVEKYLIKKGATVPLSAVCNLVYIPRYDNTYKGEMTYYQMKEKDASLFSLDEDSLKKICYPSKSELAFVKSTDTITVENYMSFLHARVNTMTNSFIDGMYKY